MKEHKLEFDNKYLSIVKYTKSAKYILSKSLFVKMIHTVHVFGALHTPEFKQTPDGAT